MEVIVSSKIRLGCMVFLSAASAHAVSTTPVSVVMDVDFTAQHPISRFIYGMNFAESAELWGTEIPRGITLNRMGGNRLSAYNWENNASNCGNDCNGSFSNDAYLAQG